jgi:hypothetical protein
MTRLGSRLRRSLAVAAVGALWVVAAPAFPQEGSPTAGRGVSVEPPPSQENVSDRIAVLPLTNRSQRGAPLSEIRDRLIRELELQGFELIEEDDLENFMRRHRMRYTAGLSEEMAEVLADETGARGALITTLDLYDERNPPKMALTSRLVSTGDRPRILWMESAVRVGDEAPGGFDLGLVSDPWALAETVIDEIVEAVPRGESGGGTSRGKPGVPSRKTRWKFRPRTYYASPELPVVRDEAGRIAVLPFSNDSTTPYAGEILTDQVIRHLVEVGADVVEPGIVRQVMLEARQFYSEGPSVPETDILRLHLEADVVVFGEVTRYREKLGAEPAQAEFLVRAIDTASRELIWASNSFAGGNRGVFFFGIRQVHAAQALASELARALVGTVLRERAEAPRKR